MQKLHVGTARVPLRATNIPLRLCESLRTLRETKKGSREDAKFWSGALWHRLCVPNRDLTVNRSTRERQPDADPPMRIPD